MIRGQGMLQSAVEYLTMYGWAILVIAIALFALAALGVFNSNNFVGQQCAISGGFSCLSYSLSHNGILNIDIGQATVSPINVSGVGCYMDSNDMQLTAPYNPPTNQIHIQIGSNYTFSTQCYNMSHTPFNGVIGDLYNGDIAVSYINSVTGYHELATGAIDVKITH